MFAADCRPILIGSLPLTNHEEALQLILTHTPEIPLWPQLPRNPREGMIRQFLTGFPGLIDAGNRYWIDSQSADFAHQMTAFYEEYMHAVEDSVYFKTSRFALKSDSASGFLTLLRHLTTTKQLPRTIKGQVTGPITAGIGVKDSNGNSIIYDANLRDILIKLLTLKACWQVNELRPYSGATPPIIFIDEPGLVSFGASGFAGISRQMVSQAISEMITAIKTAGGLAGVHICANGDWDPALASDADIISFDAYSYFDNFILYQEQLCRFLARGGILAWGIVPTGDPQMVAKESAFSLFEKWLVQLERLAAFGFSQRQLMAQTLIAPSCGTGSLPLELACKVLAMTSEVSLKAIAHLKGKSPNFS
jgi:hypothetical protein